MPTLTCDLDNPHDLRRALEIIRQRLGDLAPEEVATAMDATPTRPNLRDDAEDLMGTKTFDILIKPFLYHFYPNAATIEEIGGIMDVEDGTDATRKAHSTVAGLGRWERRSGIQVFTATNDRPKRYSLNPDLADAIRRIVEGN